ncbi:UDP-glucose 4-epimerase GalE [Parvibaculum sedimenti]|uniref:UDP-glucose 4-epimerase n=1 Tax=Parvibaculum sedimenti TaxID=2608632 RepID=A0A6N6VNE5_9HYPH|nr:UDP-glucose 4-epimerase GalE [Parvibaculum sedimenti]KAB7740672.1 UDP-glucose 4-epimerase GalE [Parvibaculum sedimenti]
MSVLVTGGAGYIGSHAVIDLLSAGEEVLVLDDLSTGFDWAVQVPENLYVGDIADETLLARIIAERKVEAVIHFAGSVVVPESVVNPLKYYLNNTAKSRSLIEACVKGGVKHFIFSSTAAVYGMTGEAAVSEDVPLNPISPYGVSKLMTEWMLRDTAAAHELTYVALRYFNVAGGDPKGRIGQSTTNATHLIKVACQTALGQRPYIDVFGEDYPTKDGTCIRDYIHVSDLAAAHTSALIYLRNGGSSLVANCGYGHGFSVREVLRSVERAAGHSIEIRQAPRRLGDPASVVSNPARIKEALGWTPNYDDLDMIVSHALAWETKLRERNR